MKKLPTLLLSAYLFSPYTATASDLTFTTNAFANEGPLPTLYTCDGKDISPAFEWNKAPANTKSFAIILSDPDAVNSTFYHWVIFNMPKTLTKLVQGQDHFPVGVQIGMNQFNHQQYNGPCPPKGDTHHYVFTLYALDNLLAVKNNATAPELIVAMKNHILDTKTLTAVYSRWN